MADDPIDPTPGAEQELQIDGSLAARSSWEHEAPPDSLDPTLPDDVDFDDDNPPADGPILPTIGAHVSLPGSAPAVAHGPRAPRHAADVAGDAFAGARHNWIPTGPRNVGGRVRAVAIDPSDPKIMYAGPASGGVYKSTDGGESWFPLWHDEPSLSMAAISICPAHPEVIWAATGESQTGGGETIPGNGVWRSDDHGETWATSPDAPAGGLLNLRGLQFDAVAAHPTDPKVCWAVGDSGAYRTTDVTLGWHQFSRAFPFADVAFSLNGAGQPTLFLVPGRGIAHRAFVVRLDSPNDPDAAIDALLPAGVDATHSADPVPAVRSQLPALAGASPPDPGNGKIAVCTTSRDVAYARFATTGNQHYAVFRTRNAQTAANPPAITWQRLADHPSFTGEGQGRYNLTLAVNPDNPNHLASGMQELWVHRSANANAAVTANGWLRAMAADIFHIDRGHHADHHQSVIAHQPPAPFGAGAAGPVALWDANDGGISWSDTWLDSPPLPGGGAARRPTAGYTPGVTVQPLPDNAIGWIKRSHGISATQMYDLTQSPLVSTMFACGFQDNGVFLGTGGPTWQLVLTADGGFVAFDPDDAYRFLCTYQGGITDARFPGQIKGVMGFIGEGVQDSLWPRELTDGFLAVDRAVFVADTAFHPTEPGRVLHARKNRVYGTLPTTGDRWQPMDFGGAIDLLYTTIAAAATDAIIEVRDTAGAAKLGLYPGSNRATATDGTPITARIRTLKPPPWGLVAADTLDLVLDGAALPTVTFAASAAMADPANATVSQLARHITAACAGRVRALPCVIPEPRAVLLGSSTTGSARAITIAGSANTLTRLGVEARAYGGGDPTPAAAANGLPALVTLGPTPVDLSGQTLTVTVDGGAAGGHLVTFDTDVPDSHHVDAADLAAALQAKLGADAGRALVATSVLNLGVRFSTTAPGVTVTLDRGAVNRMGLIPGRTGASMVTGQRLRQFNFAVTAPAPSLQLRIRDGSANQAVITFNPALGLGNLTQVSATELVRVVRAAIAGTGLRVRCDLDVYPIHSADWAFSLEGEPTELSFSDEHPGVVWAGDQSGRLYQSTDGGSAWAPVNDAPFIERRGQVEAVAVHPLDRTIVYAGAYRQEPAAAEPGFLYRSDDSGGHWRHVGGDLKDAQSRLVGINALQIDPENPDTVFAATDIGVFRTTDGAAHWTTFNEGLPNTRIRDLAFVASTRTLRCGAWGRGTYERHIGPRPPKDVVLALRANAIDDGGRRAAPTGPDALTLTPTDARNDASPDIKLSRALPASGMLLDGVEFDEDLVHEDAVSGPTNVSVQVHNRGSFPTQAVRVAVLWAAAVNGPPALPDNFWEDFRAGTLAVDTAKGPWTVIGDATLPDHGAHHDIVAPGEPRVMTFAYTWPATFSTAHRVGLLAVVTSADDPLTPNPPTDVATAVASEPKVAYREVRVVPDEEDHRFLLVATGASPITVSAPGAAFADVTPLGLPAAGPAAQVAVANAEPYDLRPPTANPRAFQVAASAAVTITFAPGDPAFRNLAQARSNEVAEVINRVAVRDQLPFRAASGQFPGTVNTALFLTARGRARLTLAPGAAATTMGLATGGSNAAIVTAAGHAAPWNLTGQSLQITVAADTVVSFPVGTPEIANLAAARAFEVRAAINRQLRIGRIPAVAAPRRIGLSLRRSVTEAAGTRVDTAGAQLGDLVTSEAEVVGDATQAALFELITVLSVDKLKPSATNHLYLRSANVGNTDLTAVRYRLFRLDPTVSPVTRTDVGTQAGNVTAGSVRVVHFTWDPGAAASGSSVFVLAVADHADRPLDPPATFPTWAAVDDFCLANAGAAYREFKVS